MNPTEGQLSENDVQTLEPEPHHEPSHEELEREWEAMLANWRKKTRTPEPVQLINSA